MIYFDTLPWLPDYNPTYQYTKGPKTSCLPPVSRSLTVSSSCFPPVGLLASNPVPSPVFKKFLESVAGLLSGGFPFRATFIAANRSCSSRSARRFASNLSRLFLFAAAISRTSRRKSAKRFSAAVVTSSVGSERYFLGFRKSALLR